VGDVHDGDGGGDSMSWLVVLLIVLLVLALFGGVGYYRR
jgi:flagellar basal body-associated protein FliL